MRYRHDHMLGLDFQSVDDLREALDAAARACVTRHPHHPGLLQRAADLGERRLHLRAGGRSCVDAEVVEVSLRSPPPLDTPLRGRARRRARVTVARRRHARGRGEAGASSCSDVPDAVPADEVVAAQEAGRERWSAGHPFPTCLVCGPGRADGLRIFPAALPDREGCSAPAWTPGRVARRRRRLRAAGARVGGARLPHERAGRQLERRAGRSCWRASPPGSAARCAWASRTRSCPGSSARTGASAGAPPRCTTRTAPSRAPREPFGSSCKE